MLLTPIDERVRNAMRASWVLLVVTLLIPPVLGALGVLSAAETASELVAYGFGWVASAVLVDFIQRSRGAQAKANRRLVVSSFTLVTAVIAGTSAVVAPDVVGVMSQPTSPPSDSIAEIAS